MTRGANLQRNPFGRSEAAPLISLAYRRRCCRAGDALALVASVSWMVSKADLTGVNPAARVPATGTLSVPGNAYVLPVWSPVMIVTLLLALGLALALAFVGLVDQPNVSGRRRLP